MIDTNFVGGIFNGLTRDVEEGVTYIYLPEPSQTYLLTRIVENDFYYYVFALRGLSEVEVAILHAENLSKGYKKVDSGGTS